MQELLCLEMTLTSSDCGDSGCLFKPDLKEPPFWNSFYSCTESIYSSASLLVPFEVLGRLDHLENQMDL